MAKGILVVRDVDDARHHFAVRVGGTSKSTAYDCYQQDEVIFYRPRRRTPGLYAGVGLVGDVRPHLARGMNTIDVTRAKWFEVPLPLKNKEAHLRRGCLIQLIAYASGTRTWPTHSAR